LSVFGDGGEDAVTYSNEREFESYIRGIIKTKVTSFDPAVYALTNKKAVDILICRDTPRSQLSFIEVKFHQARHGRLGFGNRAGGGFQPEIVRDKPAFFENRLRWILASDAHEPGKVLFVDSAVIRKYLSGGGVGAKFNNIRKDIFRECEWISEAQLVNKLRRWLRVD
jgi:hypothetical protein